MMQLYINGSLVDNFGDEDIVLNRSVNNIGDIQGRDGDGTNNFDLPVTNNNRLIFEGANVLVSGAAIVYTRIAARIEVNGNVTSIGYAQLLEAGNVFRLTYRGGNADWFAAIGDKTLKDLDLDEFNHLWTGANVQSVRAANTTWTDVYNYANVDYGLFASAAGIYWYNFYLGFFEKYLIWKIWQEIGFTPVGDFWDNNTDLPKGYIPFCANWVRDRNYDLRNSGSWDTVAYDTSGYDAWGDAQAGITLLKLTNTITSPQYNILNASNAGNFTILDKCSLTLRLRFRFSVSGTGSAKLRFAIRHKDSGFTTIEELVIDEATSATVITGAYLDYDETFTFDVERTMLQMKFITYTVTGSPIGDISNVQMDIVDYVVDEEEDYYLGITSVFNFITVTTTLPDIKQKDLLVHFFNQFCLICDTDHSTNYIDLFSFSDVRNNIPIAKDWSNKLDLSQKPVIKFAFEEYAQTNKFRYKEDEQNQYLTARPDFGNGEILIDNENLDVEKTVFQSEFASIVRQSDSSGGTIRMAFIPKFVGSDEVDCAPYIGVIEFESIHLITMDGYTEEAVQPALHEQGFSYLIPLYYPTLEDILTVAKVVSCLLRLTSVDMNQLDFSIPIWLDYFQAYFYINKINQFNLTRVDSTQVELVRL